MVGSDIEDSWSAKPLPQKIISKIMGKSYVENDDISLEELYYLSVLHFGYDGQTHCGELIVHKDLAEEVLEIFAELYEKKFPIEKIRLIDAYNADDDESMGANNSSAFCYRHLTGGGGLSTHAYGRAIDINPMQNPYVKTWEDGSLLILPPGGAAYIERKPEVKGTIYPGGDCYNAFVNRGWEWGGDWTHLADNHHFQKF